jgi:hypothetical protein
MKNDQDIQDILASATSLKRVEVPFYLKDKIRSRIENRMEENSYSPKLISSFAFCLILILLNLVQFSNSNNSETNIENLISQQQIRNSNQMY